MHSRKPNMHNITSKIGVDVQHFQYDMIAQTRAEHSQVQPAAHSRHTSSGCMRMLSGSARPMHSQALCSPSSIHQAQGIELW